MPFGDMIDILNKAFKVLSVVGALIFAYGLYLKNQGKDPFALFRRKKKDIDLTKAKKEDNTAFWNNIEDVRDNMILLDRGNTAVGAVKIFGYNYDLSTTLENRLVVEGMVELLSSLQNPIQMHDLLSVFKVEGNLKQLYKAKKNIEEKIEKSTERMKVLLVEFEQMNSNERKENLYNEITRLENFIKAKEWQLEHNEEQIKYLKTISDFNVSPEQNSYIVVSYEHNASAYSIERSKEEIFELAKRSVDTQASNIIKILSSRGVRAERVEEKELVEIVYRNFNPLYANSCDIDNKLDNAGKEIVVGSDVEEILEVQTA